MASSILSPRRLLFGLLLLAGCYGWWVASQYQQLNSLNQRQLADVAVELKSTIETAFQNIKLYEPQPGNTSAACDFDYDQPYLESVDACGDEWTRWLQPQLSVSAGVQVLATRGFSDPKAAELATAARLKAKHSARIEGQVTFRFRADLLLAELPFTERFERLLLVNGNGKVIYQEDPRPRRRLRLLRWGERGFADARAGETRGVRIQSIADLLGKDANPNWVQLKAVSDRTTVQLGGTRFQLYTHPLGIEAGTDSDLVLIGAVPVSDVLRQALAFDTYLFATLVFLALVGALGFPFIKLATIGAHERLRMRDVRWLYVSCAALVVVGTFAVLAADSYQRWTAAGDRGLVQLAQKIEARLLKEIDDVTSALVEHDRAAARLVPGPKCTPMDVVADWFNKPDAPAELGFTRNDGIYLDQVAWVDPSGQQIWKITSDRIGEKVKVAKRTYYRAVRDGNLYEHGEGGPPFFIGPDRSITDGKFYTFVSMPSTLTTQPCPPPSGADAGRDAAGGEDPIGNSSGDPYVAVATARLLSVDRVALPAEYGFVVINRDGRVLYHSDGRLSLRENFFDELSQGPVARSVVYGGNDAPLSTRYRETPHRVYFHRLGLRPHGAHESNSDPALDTASLYLATFRDVSTERAVISRTFVLSLLGPFPFLLAMMIGGIAAAGLVSARIDGRRDHWLWPQAAFQSLYRRQAGVYGAALASAFLLAWLGAGTWAFVVLPSAAIVGGLIAYRRDGPHRAPRFRSSSRSGTCCSSACSRSGSSSCPPRRCSTRQSVMSSARWSPPSDGGLPIRSPTPVARWKLRRGPSGSLSASVRTQPWCGHAVWVAVQSRSTPTPSPWRRQPRRSFGSTNGSTSGCRSATSTWADYGIRARWRSTHHRVCSGPSVGSVPAGFSCSQSPSWRGCVGQRPGCCTRTCNPRRNWSRNSWTPSGRSARWTRSTFSCRSPTKASPTRASGQPFSC